MPRKKKPGAPKAPPAVPKDHPVQMPRLAWQELIQSLMAERGIKHQNAFAEAIKVCDQTIGRWLSDNPSLPKPGSFAKVAAFLEISEEELAKRWYLVMGERFGYQHQSAGATEVREPTAAYDQPDPLLEAKALDKLDLKLVPQEQRPFIHRLCREAMDLAGEIEDNRQRLILRLRSMLKSIRDVFQSAADTERKRQRG